MSATRSAACSRLPSALRLSAELRDDRGAVARRPLDDAGGAEGHDLGAVPACRADPEVDDRRPLGDRVVADHDDDLRVRDRATAARGRRRAPCSSPRAARRDASRTPSRTSCESAEAISTVSEPESASTTESPARARAARARRAPRPSCTSAKRQVPWTRIIGAVTRSACAERGIREAALVADPAPVDLRVVAARDAAHVALADRGADVAADGAEAADGGDVHDLPGTGLEAVERRGQRADRAELDDVPRERRAVRQVLVRRDLRTRAAVARDQLAVLRHVLREPRAAVAEDAALAVERDRRRDRDRLVERPLVERHPRRAGP